jgi:[ribosomal protein S5]-alanine N-acetyltransferase
MLHLNFTPFPVITTQRLVLRKLYVKDANEILILRSDKRVNEFIDRPPTINLNDAENFIKKIDEGIADNKSIYWAITLKDDDTLIGTICLWNISIEDNAAETGYELHPDFQGKGIMQEAILRVLDFGFDTMRLETITALSHPRNIKSIHVLLRNNFLSDKNYVHLSKEDAGDLLVYYLKK